MKPLWRTKIKREICVVGIFVHKLATRVKRNSITVKYNLCKNCLIRELDVDLF